MLDQAREYLGANADLSTYTFAQSSAEELHDVVSDGSVDLLTAGELSSRACRQGFELLELKDHCPFHASTAQACHWFDWEKFWPEVRRVLRPHGGVAAFWVRISPSLFVVGRGLREEVLKGVWGDAAHAF